MAYSSSRRMGTPKTQSKDETTTEKRTSSVTFYPVPMRKNVTVAKHKVSIPERLTYRIYLDGNDVTPMTLTPPIMHIEEQQIATHEPKGSFLLQPTTSPDQYQSGGQSFFQSQIHFQTVRAESMFMSQYGTGTFMSTPNTDMIDIMEAPIQRYESDADIVNPNSKSVSMLRPRVDNQEAITTITLTLVETPVLVLLEIPSQIEPKGTEQANLIENDNANYEYLTKGKGRHRKVLNAETQTNDLILKTRSTNIKSIQKKHSDAFASGWDMLDSQVETPEQVPEVSENVKVTDVSTAERELRNKLFDVPTEVPGDQNAQLEMIQKLTSFQNAVMILERMLDSNVYKFQQSQVRGVHKPDPFRTEVFYNYRLDVLWKFSNEMVQNRPVTMLAFNTKNEDILAVGYGKFYFGDNKNGMVCIWNIKNPSQPERLYSFSVGVTGVKFSNKHPNLLAVIFYDGTLKILDIVYMTEKCLAETTCYTSFTYKPLWDLEWIKGTTEQKTADERILVVSEGGYVQVYNLMTTGELIGIRLIHVHRYEGKIKGIKHLDQCFYSDIPISVHSAILCFTSVPEHDSLYLVGTDEGCIHKCSKYYLNQHIDIFLAHNGHVYHIEYSPFSSKLFLSCGADFTIRIWCENIFEPLITLMHSVMLPVQMAVWCPNNSTVIAGIAGNSIYLWDLRKKSYLPASVTEVPSSTRLTSIKFTGTGQNLVVSDIEGNVILFNLDEMPFAPFYQKHVLIHSIYKALDTRPELVAKLKKVSSEFKTDREMEKEEVTKLISTEFLLVKSSLGNKSVLLDKPT